MLEIATILRYVCFSVVIVSLLTAYLWVYQQEMINSIDKKMTERHFEPFKTQLAYVNKLFKEQKYNAAADQADIFLSEMKHIRKLHIAYFFKRELLLKMIQSKIRLGMPYAADALPTAEYWTNSDERDIQALETYIQVLKNIPGKEKELHEALSTYHYRFPGRSTSSSGVK